MPGDTFDSAFLTGGTGFVGTHLRERLAARELPVTLLARNPEAVTARANESVVQGDITDPESRDVSGDTVVHLAADTNVPGSVERPTRAWEINADGTQNVLEAARNADAERFCYVSTASVYGPPTYLPIDEAHPMNPAEPYGASKLAGDRLTAAYASAYDLSTVIVRPFNLFGPGQPSTTSFRPSSSRRSRARRSNWEVSRRPGTSRTSRTPSTASFARSNPERSGRRTISVGASR
jgi:UDP-glucose 4-epimerase